MFKAFSLSIAITFLGSAGVSYGADLDKFCKEVPNWPKGQEVPPDASYKGIAKPVDGAFTKDKWDKMKKGDKSAGKWLIIDARSKPDRSVGKVPKAALITADYKDDSKNEFKDSILVKKINKKLKTKYASVKDMTDVNLIVFCNGKKCHRSSFGACQLRKLGLKVDQVHVMLGGFPEWKDRGYPVR